MQGMQQATPQPARTRNPFDDDGPPAPVCAKRHSIYPFYRNFNIGLVFLCKGLQRHLGPGHLDSFVELDC